MYSNTPSFIPSFSGIQRAIDVGVVTFDVTKTL